MEGPKSLKAKRKKACSVLLLDKLLTMTTMEEGVVAAAGKRKRNPGKKKPKNNNKKLSMLEGRGKRIRVSERKRNMFDKRAREYNSDDEDEEPEDFPEGSDGSEVEEGGETLTGVMIMKFSEGVRAFKLAYKKIIKKSVANDSLGPVLFGHKQLIAKKLAEEEAERKVKGEAKKEKHLVAEKGHVNPANYLDSLENFLIGIATKGGEQSTKGSGRIGPFKV